MSIRQMPHYTLAAATLAEWIERQPDRWWSVDGDPYLTSVVDFPCPSEELAPAIRKKAKPLLLQDKDPASRARGEPIRLDQLDKLAKPAGRHRKRALLLSWADSSDIDWILVEDEALVQR